MRSKVFSAALVAIASALAAPRATAFCRTTTAAEMGTFDEAGCETSGLPLYWKTQCVTYRLHEAASARFSLPELDATVRQGFALWSNPGSVCLPSIGAVALAPTNAEVGYDRNGANENLIVFRDSGWEYDARALALTIVSLDADTGEILDADLQINSENLEFGVDDLRYVIAHELGHFLGLSHSIAPGALMAPSFQPGTSVTPRPSEDDAAGICAIYPESGERVTRDSAGEEVRVAATPCPNFALDPGTGECGPEVLEHGCSVGVPRGAAGGAASAALLVLGAAALRARKRRRG